MLRQFKENARIKREQLRQARRIHGGSVGLCAAIMGVALSRLPIPSQRIRSRLFVDLYARRYPPGLNQQEAEKPLDAYRSFNAVFTRGLKPECRPIPFDRPAILSPCDGTVQEVGRVHERRLLTLKGITYSLDSLMPGIDTVPYDGGHFAILFLSPIDCHRVFSPQDGSVDALVHVPGARLLVHPPFQTAEYPVYTLNERVVLRLTNEDSSCVVVMVAGWGVGHITLPFAPGFRSKSKKTQMTRPATGHPVKRGDWIATFELGSSVVLITSASLSATPLVSPNQKVRYGQPIFDIA